MGRPPGGKGWFVSGRRVAPKNTETWGDERRVYVLVFPFKFFFLVFFIYTNIIYSGLRIQDPEISIRIRKFTDCEFLICICIDKTHMHFCTFCICSYAFLRIADADKIFCSFLSAKSQMNRFFTKPMRSL